ncbi:S53 family peptidase [Actinocrispum wychmicini]|uniref:Kumamolisin n=1 Tax=Actinocrispum wychmicini TaxID=1213861 RepID=A0A4R2JTA1_9PSEU|nr:S53 family serine peptidase [Actinocrispum wychmicini]TCO60498.1 kumamolisin [Actinocrispum wychmicini]
MRLRRFAAAIAPLSAITLIIGTVPAQASAEPLVALADNAAPLVDSSRTGDAGADQPITAALSLKLHNEGALERFLADVQNPASPQYRHFLTPNQFSEAFGPTQADVDTAMSFLKQSGATGIEVSGNRQAITFALSTGQAQSAFHTRIGRYHDNANGRDFYANDSVPALPAAVSAVVANVVGLDNHAVRKHYAVKNTADPRVVKAVTPVILKSAYGVTAAQGTGSGVNVGFVEFDGYQKSNITQYDSTNGLSAGSVTTVSVSGANFDLNPGGGQIEVELDVEVVHALAAAANDFVYEAPNSSAGELAMYQQIASEARVSVMSVSWGSCEPAEGASQARSVNNALATGAAEGISYFVAAGDDGTTDCARQTGSLARTVDFPASSPNVTAVGGTRLNVTSANAYQSESTWNDGSSGGSTGGGISTIFNAPSYQSAQSTTRRKVPDVSADASPSSGYRIFSAGQFVTVGGTSGAAPLWAGFATLQNARHGGKLGNLNPTFYSIGNGSTYTTGFHDITTGNNSFNGVTGFTAATGYDQTTGWGSFKSAALAGLIG